MNWCGLEGGGGAGWTGWSVINDPQTKQGQPRWLSGLRRSRVHSLMIEKFKKSKICIDLKWPEM